MYKIMSGKDKLFATDNLDLAYNFYEHALENNMVALCMGEVDEKGNVNAFPPDYLENLRQEWKNLSSEERNNRMKAVQEAWEKMKEENS